MNTRQAIFICAGMLFLVLNGGCGKPPTDQIVKRSTSTNAIFQPTGGSRATFRLSPKQTATLKRIVEQFNHRSMVRVENDILPAPSGFFNLGEQRFGWVPSILYSYDTNAGRFYLVKDPVLDRMGELYMDSLGNTLPLHEPSEDQWRKILSVFEDIN